MIESALSPLKFNLIVVPAFIVNGVGRGLTIMVKVAATIEPVKLSDTFTVTVNVPADV